MDDDDFWALIERANAAGDRTAWLERELRRLDDRAVQDFQDLADHHRAVADDERVYHAAWVLGGGACGDSGFDRFRGWLVGLGRDRFAAVVADPDRLADLPEVRRLQGRPPREWQADEPAWEELEYLGADELERRYPDGDEPDHDPPERPAPALPGPRDFGELPRLTAMFADLLR